MNKLILSIFLGVGGFLPSAHLFSATGPVGFEQLGFRAGFDSESHVSLFSYEVYGIADTPWSWEVARDKQLSLEIEGAIGGLSGEGETSVYARIAPQLRLDFDTLPLSLIAGPGVSVLSEEELDDDFGLGGNFQFFTSAGFDWYLDENWTVGYRFQHISNAGIHDNNPGLNLQTLSINYTF